MKALVEKSMLKNNQETNLNTPFFHINFSLKKAAQGGQNWAKLEGTWGNLRELKGTQGN